jgi:hypothetical protein
MELMTSIPSALQMPGIQSTNLICTSEPLRGLRENEATSIKKKKPAANLGGVSLLSTRLVWIEMSWGYEGGIGAYQCAGDVNATVADGGVIEPFWLGEAEEAVV